MLKIFTQKLCPLLSLTITLMGCGKEIKESNVESLTVVEGQELPSALVLKLDSSQSSTKYYAPRNANLMLPEKLWVRSGDISGKTAIITYNLKDGIDDEFDYQCIYKATLVTNEMPLLNCVNEYGEIFSDVTRFQFPVYLGTYIKMELPDTAAGISLDANYTVDWK